MDSTVRDAVYAAPSDIIEIVRGIDSPEHGFFGPGSITWQVNRENALLLGRVSAILLQLGHPMVAAGVVYHSTFDEDPIGRIRRTFDIVDAIVFGDVATAVGAAVAVREIHGSVTGELDEDLGSFEAGDRYDAARPDLLLWVHATLVDQALTAYETYVDDLAREEKERYYQESKTVGRPMGIPEEAFPDTLTDFYDYYAMILEEEIAFGTRGADLQRRCSGSSDCLVPSIRFWAAVPSRSRFMKNTGSR